MTTFTEGNLRIVFPDKARVRKFDGPSHGLSHCMKAVDFVVEENDRISFIEIKDPEHPLAREEDREKFRDEFLSGVLDEELKYKYRDTFLYWWARGEIDKPVYYWVIIAMEEMTESMQIARTDDLKRKIPLNGPPSEEWSRRIVADCAVFNIDAWNRHRRNFPLSRIP